MLSIPLYLKQQQKDLRLPFGFFDFSKLLIYHTINSMKEKVQKFRVQSPNVSLAPSMMTEAHSRNCTRGMRENLINFTHLNLSLFGQKEVIFYLML